MSEARPDRVPVIVPDLGTAGQSLSISAWYAELGDEIIAGDPLAELLLPGITCDIPAPISGQLCHIEKELDASTQPGEFLAWIIPRVEEADLDPSVSAES